jgi:hypothetical protein
MAYFSSQTRQKLMISLVGVVGISAMMLMVFGKDTSPVVMATENQLSFYPKNTLIFAEFAPDAPLFSKVIGKLGKYSQQRSIEASKKKSELPPFDLSALFEKDFEPQLSFGFWPKPKAANSPSATSFRSADAMDGIFLIKTKPNVTLNQLVEDFKLEKGEYQRLTEKGVNLIEFKFKQPAATPAKTGALYPLLDERQVKKAFELVVNTTPAKLPAAGIQSSEDLLNPSNPPANGLPGPLKNLPLPSPKMMSAKPVKKLDKGYFALEGRQLVCAESKETLIQSVLTSRQQTGLDHDEAAQEALRMLPRVRQGSVYGHMSDYFKELSALGKSATHPSLDHYIAVNNMMLEATPTTVGSLVIEPNDQLRLDFFTPFQFSKITPEGMRNDLHDLLSENTLFDTPKHLPKDTVVYMGVSSISKWLQLMSNHVATEQHKKAFEQVKTQAGLFGLDYEKNILGCFTGKLGFAMQNHEDHPQISFFFPSNPDTQKTMEQMAALATGMAKATKQEQELVGGQFKMTLLETKGKPKIAYGTILKDTFTVGMASALQDLAKVEGKLAPSLVEDPVFQTLNSAFPSKVNWITYFNMKQIVGLQGRFHAKAALPAQKPEPPKTPVQAFSAAGYLDGNKIIHTQVHVKMAPGILKSES